MACYSMHLAFAKIVNEKLKMNEKDFCVGALAADICKKEFYTKRITHFGNEHVKVKLNEFLKKYNEKLDNPFIMGYLVHIYLDYVFFERFLSNFFDIIEGEYYSDMTSIFKEKKSGKILTARELYSERFYNTYTNINKKLVEKYNLPAFFEITDEDLKRYNVIDEYNVNNLLNINNEIEKFINSKEQIPENDDIYTIDEFEEFINKYAKEFINEYENINLKAN
ncbi:MAG: hypothetical protein E7311_02310 [Clostridiales bacterium]|nr:hypothetical protein [Clostridiales bacterium]